MKSARPPRFPSRILARVLRDEEDSAFHGDLDERFDQIAQGRGLPAARRWYWRQAASVAVWALLPDRNRVAHTSAAGLGGDLRLGVRTLRRSPLYALGVCGTIALGLAAAMTTFAVAWNVWLAPMPYPDPDRVVRLYEVEPLARGEGAARVDMISRRQPLSPTLLGDLKETTFSTIESVSAVDRGDVTWVGSDGARKLSSVMLHREGFGILGITPLLGTLPVEPEVEGGSEIMLSERFWRTAFGGDPDVVGSVMDLGWGDLPIVGVASVPGGYPGDVDVVMMAGWGWRIDTEDRGFRNEEAIARVRPGSSVAAANAELNGFLRSLAETYGEHDRWGLEAVVLADDLFRPLRGVLALLLASGATFLVLAGVNVMGLVAARRIEGRRDRSIRLALGASEARLLRGTLAESIVLAVIGSTGGAALAYWLIEPIRSIAPPGVPRLSEVGVGLPLVVAGLSVGTTIGIAIGLAGYLISRHVTPAVGRTPVWRAVGIGGRRALVIGQVALTTLLTAAGASILHRVATLSAMDLGYEPEGVSFTSVVLDEHPDRVPRWTLAKAIIEELEARGVRSAMAFNTPMANRDDIPQVGMPSESGGTEIVYDLHLVSPGYFDVMGVEIVAGRDFAPDDHAASQRVVIVSETFVRRYFPDGTAVEAAVGREIAPLIYETTRPVVVGVVRSTRHRGPDLPLEPEVYSPMSQLALDLMTLVVRGEPEDVAEAVSTVTAGVDPRQRWSQLTPFASRLRAWFGPLRLQMAAMGVLAGLGTLLAGLGLYSLMAFQVASRRDELGVRKALGARDATLMMRVVGTGMVLAFTGMAAGLVVWYRLAPIADSLLGGLGPAGAPVAISVALVVGATALAATLLPALRVMRVDIVATLKSE